MSKSAQVTELLEKIGWGKYNYITFTACGLSWLSCMLWNGNISIAIKEAGSYWSLSHFEKGFLGTIYTLGLLFGSYFWGYLGNSKGRLRSLYYDNLGAIVSGIGYTVSYNYIMILIFSFLQGFFMGGVYVLAGALYSESSPKTKGWTLVLLAVCIAFGGVLVYFLAVVVVISGNSDNELWRYVGACGVFIQILCFFSLLCIYESPMFLISQNNFSGAKEVIEKIAKVNHYQGEINITQPVNYDNINEEDLTIEVISTKSIKELFNPNYRKTTLLITLVMVTCDLPWAALYSFMPILLSEIGAEIKSSFLLYLTLLIQSIFCIPGTVLSSFLATTSFGRKWTTVLGFFMTSASVLFFLVSRNYTMVLISTCLINFFDFLGFSTLMALVTESYPTNLRSLGLGWATSMLKLGAVISPAAIGYIFDLDGGIVIGVVILSFFFMIVAVFSCFLQEVNTIYSDFT